MSLGDLETQEDANELLGTCCPCKMPLCPVIAKVCKSIYATLSPEGFFDPAATEWKVYKRLGITGTWVDTTTESITGVDPEVDGLPEQIATINLETFSGQSYDKLYEGNIGLGSGDCVYHEGVLTDECSAEGSSNLKEYNVFPWTSGEGETLELHYAHGLGVETDKTMENVSGLETDEHVAWDAEFAAAIAAWEAGHPSGPTWQEANTTHADWQTALETRTNWETNRDNWVAEDPENRDPEDYAEEGFDPEPPEPGTEPESTGIDDEPTEFYPECWFKVTITTTWYPYWFDGYGPIPYIVNPADPEAFDAWVAAGDYGDGPPAPGTLVQYSFGGLSDVPGMLNAFGHATSYATTDGYSEGLTFAEWVTLVRGVIDAEMTLPKPGCEGSECNAFLTVSEPNPTAPFGGANVSSQRSEVRFQVPATWPDQFSGATVPFTGDYYGITYDVVDTPDGWDAPMPTVFRAFHLEDQTLEWEGPGSGDQSHASWLTPPIALDPPGPGVTRSVENIRFICQPDSPWGTLPQVIGTAVTLPDS